MSKWRKAKKQLHKRFSLKRDNRGSAIIIVIIAMAMISVLATTLLWMAYTNYKIKVNDIKNKNSFYSAEIVVEQIMAGLQNTASSAVGAAYEEMSTQWGELDGNNAVQSEQNRYNIFATSYMDTLAELLKDPARGSGFYDRDVLKAYVDADIFDETSATTGVDVASWENGNKAGDPAREPILEMVNDNSIVLRNIYVSYTDGNGMLSIVQTDICIDVPELVFTHTNVTDLIYEYVIIGNEGVEMTTGSGTVNAEGSIYAGTDAQDKGGILINAAATLAVNDAKKVISKGNIRVEGPSAAFIVRDTSNKGTDVYAQNIYLNSGTVSLDSKTYVANDLSLNGSGSRATLTKEYYGYGTSVSNGLSGEPPIDSSASSAIIINGNNSMVDMSGITRLLIAGRAYIGQSTTGTDAAQKEELGTAGEPVMMGESIAVKGGQVAYLVPAECIGTMDNEVVIGHNPLNGDKYDELQQNMIDYGSAFNEVDFNKKVYKLGNKSLSEFGVTSASNIKRVFTQYNGGTLVYYYLVMDQANAEKYFVQYYDFTASKNVLDGYFTKYAGGGIVLGDYDIPGNQYTILGNSLVSDALSESGVALLTGFDQSTLMQDDDEEGEEAQTPTNEYREVEENASQVTNAKSESEVIALSAEIENIYAALTNNLSEDASSINPTQNVFSSMIRESVVNDYLAANGGTVTLYTDVSESGVTSGLQAVVTNQADLKVSSLSNHSDVRLIISTGNVTIDRNFSGLVIAKGKVTIDGAVGGGVATIKRDDTGLYRVLSAQSGISGDTMTPLDMFVDSSGSIGNGAADANVNSEGDLQINYGEIVRYMNWIKK